MIQKIKIKELNDLFSSFKYKGDIYKIVGFLNDVDLIKGNVCRIIACKNKQTGKYKIIDVSKKGNPNKVGHLKGRKIRLSASIEKEILNFIFCEYELNIGTYHPFLLSKKCYFNDFYEKDGHTYTCFMAKDSHGNSYPFEIKDYL